MINPVTTLVTPNVIFDARDIFLLFYYDGDDGERGKMIVYAKFLYTDEHDSLWILVSWKQKMSEF